MIRIFIIIIIIIVIIIVIIIIRIIIIRIMLYLFNGSFTCIQQNTSKPKPQYMHVIIC